MGGEHNDAGDKNDKKTTKNCTGDHGQELFDATQYRPRRR